MTSIVVEEIRKSFPARKSRERVEAVAGVSFTVERGEMVGLLGPNGAGKTTTLKVVCGLLLPDSGRVLVNGIDNRRERQRALQHISAVLEGNRNLYWRLTARENMEYFAGNRGRWAGSVRNEIRRLLRLFRLEGKADEQVNNLSRGMQQKLAIAVAMLAGTEVVLLDEPTLGLDVETGHDVREILLRLAREEERTVLLSTHDMPVVQHTCDRAIIISSGRIVADDNVPNLLRLFDTRAYTVRLGRQPSPAQRTRLRAAFPVLEDEGVGATHLLRVGLSRSEEIYELIEILRAEATPIEAIDRVTVDFEEVFRRLVNGQQEPATTPVSSHDETATAGAVDG